MGEIFKSPIPCDKSKIPEDVAYQDYIFQQLNKILPQVAEKPWLCDVTSGKRVLFGEVERLTKKAASSLAKKGFQLGDVLYFVTYDIVDLCVLQLAVWMLGGATRGSFQQETPEEFARQMDEVQCKFVAVDADTAPIIKNALDLCDWECQMINVGDSPVEGAVEFSDLTKDDGKALPNVKINPREVVALICNTSGSTGVPKGVIHSHHSLLSAIACFEGKLFTSLDESQLITASNFALSNSWTTSFHLSSGCTLYCTGRYKKEDFVSILLKYKPTSVFLYPYIAGWFARCPELSQHDFNFIKKIMLGGSVIDPTTLQLIEKSFPGCYVNMTYASTEAMGVSLTLNSDMFSFPLYGKTPEGEPMVSSGFLFPLVKAKVVDIESGKVLGRNEIGRLFVHSAFMMKGYWVKGQQPDRSDFDEEGWFDTGDLAFFDTATGQLFVRERASFVFKYYMHFVNPSEIEAVLQEDESVQMSCVIGIANKETTNLAKALVVLKSGKEVSKEKLLKLVEDKMPFYKHLHGGLEFVDSLPENRGRKMDRVAIYKQYGAINI